MDIDVISSQQDFLNLKPQWDELSAKVSSSNIFLTHLWLATWWKHFGEGREIFILVVRRQNQVVGIAPMMKVRRLGFTCLEFIGSSFSDFEGLLLSPGEEQGVCEAMIDFFDRTRVADVWRLRRLKENSAACQALQSLMAAKKVRYFININRHKETAPYLEMNIGLDEFFRKLRPKFTADTHRLEKKLQREQDFYIIDGLSQADRFLEEMKQLHVSRRRDKATKSFFEDDRTLHFLKEIVQQFDKEGWVDFKILSCRGKLAAAHLGFSYQGVYSYYFPVFDDSFYPYAPSRILLKQLIVNGFEKHYQMFDLMLGEEEYKLKWNPHLMSLYFCHIAPRTIKGASAFLLFDKIAPRVKKIQGTAW